MTQRASVFIVATAMGICSCESAGGDPPLSKVQAPISDSESQQAREESDKIRPKPAASRPNSMALIDVDKGELYVGRLIRNEVLSMMHPSEYCLEDGKLWQGAAYRIGRVNVFGVDSALSKLTEYSPVVVYGENKPNLSEKLASSGPCPDNYEPVQVQMRSDWIAPRKKPEYHA